VHTSTPRHADALHVVREGGLPADRADRRSRALDLGQHIVTRALLAADPGPAHQNFGIEVAPVTPSQPCESHLIAARGRRRCRCVNPRGEPCPSQAS
jgi:hypothetical protein